MVFIVVIVVILGIIQVLVYKDCKNRKYGDFEFKMYKKINGKELESKYNKNYVNNNVDINSENEDSEENISTDEDEEDD